MFKLFAAFVALGLTIGSAASVRRQTEQVTAEIAEAGSTMSTPALAIRPAPPDMVPSAPGHADRLVQVAKDLSISSERLHALAQDAASDGDGTVCIEVMISVWGPAEAERVMRENDLGSNG